MDQQVAKSLGELELKLQELERELTTIGHRDTPAKPGHVPGKLIDEAVEGGSEVDVTPPEVAVDSEAFGGPAVFGGEEVPAQPGATVERDWTVEVRETAYGEIPTPPSSTTPAQTPPLPPPASFPQAAAFTSIPVSQRAAPDAMPTASPIPSPYATSPPRPPTFAASRSIDVEELVRFRDKLASTMDELIDEYNQLLDLEPSSRPPSDA